MKNMSRLKIEAFLLLAGLAWMLVSFYNSFGDKPEAFFARSGAVVVILAIYVEFQLSKESHKMLHNNFFAKANGLKTIPILPIRHIVLSWCAHTLVVVGTLVWGYGDLWHQKIA